jgi:hypothetical protein
LGRKKGFFNHKTKIKALPITKKKYFFTIDIEEDGFSNVSNSST